MIRASVLLWLLCQPLLAISQQTPERTKAPIEKQEVGQKSPEGQANPPKDSAPKPGTPVKESVAYIRGPVDSGKQKPGNSEPEKGWVYQLRTDPVATFTCVLAIGTFLLWWATKRLVKGAEKTAERQLRAYVFVQAARLLYPDSTEAVRIEVNVRNFGQTPADDYTATLFVEFDGELRADSSKQRQSKSSLAPGWVVGISTNLLPFTEVERAALKSGTKLMYVFGVIKYKDAFGNDRSTDYRYVYGGNYGSAEGDLAMAEHGNDAK